jgi:hypothetical protein
MNLAEAEAKLDDYLMNALASEIFGLMNARRLRLISGLTFATTTRN